MTPPLQTLLALFAVLAAAGWLLRRAVRQRRQPPGCGGDCGCPASEFKEQLRDQEKMGRRRA
jgi:hypothetical protein